MTYAIEFLDSAKKQLSKMDIYSRKKILKYISGVLAKIDDPRLLGKALTGNLGEFWRYRIGDFRILCKIDDARIVILITKIAHRKNAYI